MSLEFEGVSREMNLGIGFLRHFEIFTGNYRKVYFYPIYSWGTNTCPVLHQEVWSQTQTAQSAIYRINSLVDSGAPVWQPFTLHQAENMSFVNIARGLRTKSSALLVLSAVRQATGGGLNLQRYNGEFYVN